MSWWLVYAKPGASSNNFLVLRIKLLSSFPWSKWIKHKVDVQMIKIIASFADQAKQRNEEDKSNKAMNKRWSSKLAT